MCKHVQMRYRSIFYMSVWDGVCEYTWHITCALQLDLQLHHSGLGFLCVLL